MRPHAYMVAKALCEMDNQRHLRLEDRNGKPCRLHASYGDVAMDAIEELMEEENSSERV